MNIYLKGIAWAHTRALAPLQVTSQVYKDFHPEVTIDWETRSLHAFGEGALDTMAEKYDFLLIDHPFMGQIASKQLMIPLDAEMDASVISRLSLETVGQSFNSYHYKGHQWALPIDAAAQVACSREDLLTKAGFEIPKLWADVIALARETKRVAMPMTPMGLLGVFFTLCANQGESPFSKHEDRVVHDSLAEQVLMQIRNLYDLIPEWCIDMYPPGIFNKMATNGEIWYVPFAYGYINYSMKGYAPYILSFHNIPAAGKTGCNGSTLGGVGIGLSVNTKHKKEALDYMSWITSADCQKTLYTYSGGQAANVEAWNDDAANFITNNFYKKTKDTLEQSFVRPRYDGFHGFQSIAGRILQDCFTKKRNIKTVLNEMNEAYLRSK
jgi:multiple sugar transport system substrate-binding protein